MKTFSPVRMLINLNEDKWEEFVSDSTDSNLACVETLISINEIFPNGMSVYNEELGKFMADLDTLQVTLSFIAEHLNSTKNTNAFEVLEDLRMSIQNFMFYLEIKSYYSAFQSFRKILEGLLWTEEFKKDINKVPEEITRFEYQKKLCEIDDELGDMYKYLNNVFHFTKQTPFFNINSSYQVDDFLYKTLTMIDSIADKIINKFSDFLSSVAKTEWKFKRFAVILQKNEDARATFFLRNKPIRKTGDIVFPGNWQNSWINAIKNKGNIFDNDQLISLYCKGFREELYKPLVTPQAKKPEMEPFFNYLYKFDKRFLEFIPFLNKEMLAIHNEWKKIMSMQKTEKLINLYKEDINEIISAFQVLMKQEIKKGGSIFLAFLRSVVEDVLLNFRINKHVNPNSLVFIYSAIKDKIGQEYLSGIDVSWAKKYNHILINKRQVFISEAGRGPTGESELHEKYFSDMNSIIKVIVQNVELLT